MSGTLFGVGLGPGDPELLTLKAHRLICRARVVAYPAPDTGESFARSIAAAFIPPDAEEIVVRVPMRTEPGPAQAAYDRAAVTIGNRLAGGMDVVALCEGDPFFYGSFIQLFERLSPRFPCEVVPGVSSLTACAAALSHPLTVRDDTLSVLPATLDDDALRRHLDAADGAAIVKLGRHLPRVRALIGAMGLTSGAGYVERASLPHGRAAPLAEAPATAPYFSMILVRRRERS